MKREEIFQYVKEQYGTEPEYLWKKDPDSAVLRHKNGKWYAIIMVVEKKILGLEEDGNIDILDVKCDPDLVGMIIQTYGFLPGYHMNKQHWITCLLYTSFLIMLLALKARFLMKNRTSINPDLNWLFGFHILFYSKIPGLC